MSSSTALKIDALVKTYANGVQALKGVSLEVPAGDFFALLGPNGAGKTTIIGTTCGLVNKSGGTVSVFGHDIDTEPEMARAQIGLVGQEINFNPFEKPLDIVVNQGGYYGVPRSEAIPRAKQLLTDLGLGEKMNDRSMALSSSSRCSRTGLPPGAGSRSPQSVLVRPQDSPQTWFHLSKGHVARSTLLWSYVVYQIFTLA